MGMARNGYLRALGRVLLVVTVAAAQGMRDAILKVGLVAFGASAGSFKDGAVSAVSMARLVCLLLFPTAGYDLSRISPLFVCSLCISPCSF